MLQDVIKSCLYIRDSYYRPQARLFSRTITCFRVFTYVHVVRLIMQCFERRSVARSDQLLPAVAGRCRPADRRAGGAAVRVPRHHGPLDVRRPHVSPGRLRRGHALVRLRLHLHVDLC